MLGHPPIDHRPSTGDGSDCAVKSTITADYTRNLDHDIASRPIGAVMCDAA